MSAVPVVVSRVVDRRDDFRCVRCGEPLTISAGSRHHRQRRRVGGHLVVNLILLCGSGTTGCHGWVHAHPAAATAAGFVVQANGRATPDVLPVRVWWPRQRPYETFLWVILREDGGREIIPEAEARELFAAFGIDQVKVSD